MIGVTGLLMLTSKTEDARMNSFGLPRSTALAKLADGPLSIICRVDDRARLLEDSAVETGPDHGRLAAAN
jgi:hypothetical protein